MPSKRSNACQISLKVREEVFERDCEKCIICKGRFGQGIPNAHYIRRSQGGLGVPQNVVTLCNHCHSEEDKGQNSIEYHNKIKEYLCEYYGASWNETDLIYEKNKGIFKY